MAYAYSRGDQSDGSFGGATGGSPGQGIGKSAADLESGVSGYSQGGGGSTALAYTPKNKLNTLEQLAVKYTSELFLRDHEATIL